MTKVFEYQSNAFNTGTAMEKEKKELHQALCEWLGVKREDFRLQRGLITLEGQTEGDAWIGITNVIGNFKERMSAKQFKAYRITSRLQREA